MKTKARNYGVLPDAPDVRDIQYADLVSNINITEKEYFNDIKNMVFINQRSIGSCVGHAGAHYLQARENKRKFEVSARFLYAMCKAKDGVPHIQGTYPRVLASVVKDIGAVLDEDVDNKAFGMKHDEYVDVPLTSELKRKAMPRRIIGYASLNPKNINELKKAVIEDGGVMISVRVGDWNGKKVLPYDAKTQLELDNAWHYIYIYAFKGDDFYFVNSWGKNWGYRKDGIGIFNYWTYKDHMRRAYVFSRYVTEEDIKKAKETKYVFIRNMYHGVRGQDVKILQELLNELFDMRLVADGIFGRNTLSAVKKFQKVNGLYVDGYVGRNTKKALNNIIKNK